MKGADVTVPDDEVVVKGAIVVVPEDVVVVVVGVVKMVVVPE